MRLDAYLSERGLAKSRTAARKMIEAGLVCVSGATVTKPSFDYKDGEVTVTGELIPYVSRGGLKLEAALDAFSVDVAGLRCIDVGASTGGFTDCLLQRGAAGVLCVDCGHGQLDPKIASDPRVISLEGFNARELSPEKTGGLFKMCVMDVSFISQTLIHPALATVLEDGARFVSLIKPQFEVGRSDLNGKGIVKTDQARRRAVERVLSSAGSYGFTCEGIIDSPIEGGDGNREYLASFIFSGGKR